MPPDAAHPDLSAMPPGAKPVAPRDAAADALGACIADLRKHAAAQASAGDRAGCDATFDLIEHVARLAQMHARGSVPKPRARREAA